MAQQDLKGQRVLIRMVEAAGSMDYIGTLQVDSTNEIELSDVIEGEDPDDKEAAQIEYLRLYTRHVASIELLPEELDGQG